MVVACMFPVGRIRAVQACKPKQNERSNLRLRRRLINTFPTRRTATRGIHRQRTVASRPTCALFFFFDSIPTQSSKSIMLWCFVCFVCVYVCVCFFPIVREASREGSSHHTIHHADRNFLQNRTRPFLHPPDPRISISSSLARSDTYYENLTRMGWGRRG